VIARVFDIFTSFVFCARQRKNEGQKKKKYHSAEGSNPDRVGRVNKKSAAANS
jgi:hypothetical protein